ncbi:MAG TPA: aspartate aminotransferase family protein [Bacteroidota bacterium]|nr:aspartate aminotransferase family protein [Bacteroidota bacterium]
MNITEREAQHFFHTYKRLPLEIDHGEGVYLFTKDGTRYLDMFAGLAVNALGYAHPKEVKAIAEQAGKYIHLSNYYLQEPQVRLAEMLMKYSGFARLFFTNSGTESIEGAIKISRKWGSKRGKTEIISFSNAFHGRTMGALSMMDRPKYRDGYEPFLENFKIVELNDPAQLRAAVSEKTAAVFLEFIQGEGGIVPASKELANEIVALKAKFGFLLVADEIQSGVGRTGKFFGFQHYNVAPDLVTVAKPIGAGLPLGAILGNAAVADVLEPGVHGTTFGGNPVACAAGIVVLEEVMENGLMANAEKRGAELMNGLSALKAEFPSLVKEVRGYGLMVGMELTKDGEGIVTAMRAKNVLINCTNVNVLRFLPPLIVESKHVTETINKLREVMKAGA